MHVPKTRWGQFGMFFLVELISFFILCACTRAQAAGLYGWTAITSGFWSFQCFFVNRTTVEDSGARSWAAGFGMTLGGVLGDVIAIWCTNHAFRFGF